MPDAGSLFEDFSNPISAARRCSRSVQTTVGWIFWDPGAVSRYEALGLPGPLGYIAARSAPLAPAGPDAVVAAFGSVSPAAIRGAFDTVQSAGTTFEALWVARDQAVLAGLEEHAPAILEPLRRLGSELWPVIEELPTVGRVLFASHLRMPRPDDLVLSGWHAVNCLREWRGDTHWALVVAAELSGIEASILHNAWLDYDDGWLPRSRGSSLEEIESGWEALRSKGLAEESSEGWKVNIYGIALRQQIEDETDRLGALPWRVLGPDGCRRFAEELEPPCELLLRRVDETAGPNYQPGSRIRPGR